MTTTQIVVLVVVVIAVAALAVFASFAWRRRRLQLQPAAGEVRRQQQRGRLRTRLPHRPHLVRPRPLGPMR